jgi:hypothetical protein
MDCNFINFSSVSYDAQAKASRCLLTLNTQIHLNVSYSLPRDDKHLLKLFFDFIGYEMRVTQNLVKERFLLKINTPCYHQRNSQHISPP